MRGIGSDKLAITNEAAIENYLKLFTVIVKRG